MSVMHPDLKIIWTEKWLENVAGAVRKTRRDVVFTNGCFDMLHAGHLDILWQARALGQVLIVGMNSDESVRALKGEKRPIIPEEQRAYLLGGLECVDYVYVFNELTANRAIDIIRPNIYAKAGFLKAEQIPEAITARKHGKVMLLERSRPVSTTEIIAKVLERTGDISKR